MVERGDDARRPRGTIRWALDLSLLGLGAFALSGVLLWPRDDWTLFGILPVTFFIPYLIAVIVRTLIRRPMRGPAAAQPIMDHLVDVTQLAWAAAVFVDLALHARALHDGPRTVASAAFIALACASYIHHRRARIRPA